MRCGNILRWPALRHRHHRSQPLVHELRRDGQTLCWLMFPIERLKELARTAMRDRSAQHDDDDARRRVAANDSGVSR
jgi:hypothetical protein